MAEAEHYLKRELYQKVRSDPAIFDFLQAGSLDGIWYWDIENPSEEWMSARFKECFGYTEEQIPNTSSWWQENIHPDDLALVLENFNKHCADERHRYDQIVRYRHKDGQTIWVRCRGIAVRDARGKPVRMLGAHTDVTALKEAEGRLARQKDELARFNRLMVGREQRMIELKQEVNALSLELGRAAPYDLSRIDGAASDAA